MSRENVELVRRIVASAQGDWDWLRDVLHPDVRLDQSRFPDGGVYHGRAAFRDFYRDWFGVWDELKMAPERFLDRGERVIVLMVLEGRGRASGTPVTIRTADAWTIRDGKVVEVVGYPDRGEAMKAIGIPE